MAAFRIVLRIATISVHIESVMFVPIAVCALPVLAAAGLTLFYYSCCTQIFLKRRIMSYDPAIVIKSLKSLSDLSPTVVAAVKARIAMLLSITLAELLPILEENGLTSDQVYDMRVLLQSGGPPAPPTAGAPGPVAAAASGAPVQVRA